MSGLLSFMERFQDATIGFSGYPRLVRDRSHAFGFMALLLFLAVGIAGGITTVQTYRLMGQVSRQILAGPAFRLQEGQFHFDGAMPYRWGGDDFFTVIVDTTGQTAPDALRAEPPNSILITRTAVYQVDPLGNLRTNDLSTLPLAVSREDVAAYLSRLYQWVPALYLIVYLFQLGLKAAAALILGGAAVHAGRGLRRRVPLGLGFALGLYAMSLPNVLQWIWPGFRTYTLRGMLLWWGLSMVYLLQGLKACAAAGILEPAESGPTAK